MGKGWCGRFVADSIASVFTAANIGASWRLSIHQISPPASRVSRIAAISVRCCIALIGAKASAVGSTSATYQFALGTRLTATNTSTPAGLTRMPVPSSPPM